MTCPLNLSDCDMDADGIDLHYLTPDEVPTPCFICGDPMDHHGHAHGLVTGDGKTRADVA